MWLKLLLAALSVAFCTLIGYFAADKYRARGKFFSAMNTFNEKYLSELRYARKPLTAFLKENKFTGDFAALINGFASSRNVKTDRSYLSDEERQLVEGYLGMLGKGDSHTQSGFFEAQREILTEKQTRSEKEAKERGQLYLKLGFLAGLAFVILIV